MVRSFKHRLTFLMLLCMASGTGILVRAAYIQLLKNPRLEAMAKRQFQTHALIRPHRGTITDRKGEALAINVEKNSLAANPHKILNKRAVARSLSRATDVPFAKLLKKLNEPREFIWIKRHLSELELKRFKKWHLIDADGDWIDGLWIVKESDRIYPYGQLASHIVGDVNVDSEGLEGIELWFNERLRGKVTSVDAIKDARGRPTFIDVEAANSVQDGKPVALTIDAALQFEVEQALAETMGKTQAASGSVIVMNADNGEILSMANYPTFDPNAKSSLSDHRRNRALTDGYEPGSTMKAVLLASALSHGAKLSDQVYGEKGSYAIQNHKITESEVKEKFDWLSLKRVLQVSSNIGAAKIALKLGADHYIKTLKSAGFGQRTGSGFPGEISGRLPARKEWQPLTLANVGFGQGILVTPLQMTRAYAALANGGWLVEPTLLRNTRKTLQRTRIFSSSVSAQVTEALESVTGEGGTGVRAALPGYRVAGKTGTAQKVDPSTGKYSKTKYVGSFIGFPLDVGAKIVIFTAVTDPKGSYYAAETAAPLFRNVLASVANRCSLPMNAPMIKNNPKTLADNSAQQKQLKSSLILNSLKHSASANSEATQESLFEDLTLTSLSPENSETTADLATQNDQENPRWVMPSLRGLAPREMIRVLKGYNLHLKMTGQGIVSAHFPEAGKSVAEGDTIRVILSEP